MAFSVHLHLLALAFGENRCYGASQ